MLFSVAFSAFALVPSLLVSGQPLDLDAKPLVDYTFREPTEHDLAKIGGYLESLDLTYLMMDRYSLRCEGEIHRGDYFERFSFLHAEDREQDALRHIYVRKYLDDDSPLLSFSIEGSGGYSTGPRPGFPERGDRLRIGDRNYFINDPATFLESREILLTQDDRYFSPLSCSLLARGNFSSTVVSRSRPGRCWNPNICHPEGVSKAGGMTVVRYPGKYRNQAPLAKGDQGPSNEAPDRHGFAIFVLFQDEVPKTLEVWRITGERKECLARTVTEWQEIRQEMLPIAIEATEPSSKKVRIIRGKFEWKFNDEVPDELFEIADVTQRRESRW